MATKKNRSGWDEAMGNIVQPKPTKRSSGTEESKPGGPYVCMHFSPTDGHTDGPRSIPNPPGRQAVLSKAMRVVDEETRREVRDARLEALEADNYVENQDAGDEAYVDSEVCVGGGGGRILGGVVGP